MKRNRISTLAIAVLGALATAAPAAAQPVLVHEGGVDVGPLLAGDVVVWSQSKGGGATRVRGALPGAQASTLARFEGSRGRTQRSVNAIAVSAQALAVDTAEFRFHRPPRHVRLPRPPTRRVYSHRRDGKRRVSRGGFQELEPFITVGPTSFKQTLLGGPLGQPLGQLAQTESEDFPSRPCRADQIVLGGIAVAGASVIRGELVLPCTGRRIRYPQSRGRVLVQDAAAGSQPSELFSDSDATYLQVEAAGDFVAIGVEQEDFNASRIVLVRRSTGQVVLDQTVGELGSFDVQDDGTVAYMAVVSKRRQFYGVPTLMSPAAPAPRALPVRGTPFFGIKIAGNRLAYAGDDLTLVVSDLSGGRVPFGGLGSSLFLSEGGVPFDLSPTRITWQAFTGHFKPRILAEDFQ